MQQVSVFKSLLFISDYKKMKVRNNPMYVLRTLPMANVCYYFALFVLMKRKDYGIIILLA